MINITATVHVHQAPNDAVLKAVRELAAGQARLEAGQAHLLAQGARNLMVNEANHALLDQINDYTNVMAEEAVQQTAVITEIGTDLDALIAASTDTVLTERLTSLRDRAQEAALASTAQKNKLLALASKYDAPIPDVPPVEEVVPGDGQ
jgi:hypothetical protein